MSLTWPVRGAKARGFGEYLMPQGHGLWESPIRTFLYIPMLFEALFR
jgi:hypothetical protein